MYNEKQTVLIIRTLQACHDIMDCEDDRCPNCAALVALGIEEIHKDDPRKEDLERMAGKLKDGFCA